VKKIITFKSSEECLEHIRSLWATDLFQKSEYIDEISMKVSDTVPVFYDFDEEFERSHFTPWFGAVAYREYENKYIQDLYYFHEYYHIVTMTYDSDCLWTDWYTKMMLNELNASINSEVMIYSKIPGLREKTFTNPIWADRFESPVEERVREERIKIIRDPNPFDFIELQISNYAEQNRDWARIWRRNWKKVEAHMVELAKTPVGERGLHHKRWLIGSSSPWSHVPFEDEAREFYRVFVKNRDRFGNGLFNR